MSEKAEIWRAISIGLFVLCLLMPGYNAENGNYYGWFLLLTGYYALPSGEVSWLANIFLFMSWSWLTISPRFLPLMSAIIAIILALTFAVKDTAWVYNWSSAEAEFSLGIGYYAWFFSMVFAAIAAYKNMTS